MTYKILNILTLLITPFLFSGLINRVKSFWAGRKGPPLLQPLYHFIKLMQKEIIAGDITSPVFQLSPVIGFSVVLFCGLLIPVLGHRAVISFEYDFILFAYTLGLARFLSVIAALDTGSSFEGMGASREITFTALVEPGFFILLGSLALVSGGSSFQNLFSLAASRTCTGWLIAGLSAIALFIMLLVESCRVPVDDPSTHLELTMIHEVMVLDNSGPDLAVISYGAGMKMTILASLIANIVVPAGLGAGLNVLLFFSALGVQAVLIGCIESLMARLRMTHIPQFIFFMTVIGIMVFFMALMAPVR